MLAEVYGEPQVGGVLTRLVGQASTRVYYRFEADQGAPRSVIVMDLPPDAYGSDEGGAKGTMGELPFLDVQRYLTACGVPVPAVYHVNLDQGVVILEDLGDETFESRLERVTRDEREGLYQQAIDLLVEMQERCREADGSATVAFRRAFELPLLRWELDHFVEWGIAALGEPLSTEENDVIEQAFSQLLGELERMPRRFVHRDFQSRNLMWDKTGRLRLIDFQDALLGPPCYDLAALLCDSYVDLDEPLQVRLLRYYASRTRQDESVVARQFWTVAAHRKMKDAGRFVFIDRVRGNPAFLQHFPQSVQYVDRALGKLGLVSLQQLLFRRLPGYPDTIAVPESE